MTPSYKEGSLYPVAFPRRGTYEKKKNVSRREFQSTYTRAWELSVRGNGFLSLSLSRQLIPLWSDRKDFEEAVR